jgi:hypothetical protein
MRHAACLPARMGGGGKTGIDTLARASGHSPPLGGVYSGLGNERAKPLAFPPRIAQRSSRQRDPCNGAKPPDALRARKCASGRRAMREARVPAGQNRKHRTLRSAQRGTECVRNTSRSTSPAPDRHPIGTGLQARSALADRAWSPVGAANGTPFEQVVRKEWKSGSVLPQQAIDQHREQQHSAWGQ